jgi:hypothetical protein
MHNLNRPSLILHSSAFCALMLIASSAHAQGFSADLVDSSNPALPPTHNPVFVQGDKMRMELRDVETPMSSGIVLLDFQQQTATVVLPEQHIYLDAIALDFARKLEWHFFRPASAEDACVTWMKTAVHGKFPTACKNTGVEMVNGRASYKYEGNGISGIPDATLWVDQSLGVLMKVDGQGAHLEMQNLREAPQTSTLFEIPAGFQKMSASQLFLNAPRRR